jgi:ATP synthase protein I
MKYAGIGTEMVLVIVLFTYLGNWLDQRQPSETPWFTILMLFIGLGAALYLVFKQLK